MRRDALLADCGGMQRVLTAHWLALDPSAVRLFRHPHPATRSHAGWQLCADLPSTHPRSLASHADGPGVSTDSARGRKRRAIAGINRTIGTGERAARLAGLAARLM
jgi:hypothetical protein